jgi:predicted nucleic acid-binding protein
MSTFVVDTSVVMSHFVADQYTPYVHTLFDPNATHQIHVPEFCLIECVNVIWKHVRFNQMPLHVARQMVQDVRDLPLDLVAASEFLPRALEIGLAHGLAIYDSVYIALAEALACPLITVDQRQSNAGTAVGVALKPIADFAPPTP